MGESAKLPLKRRQQRGDIAALVVRRQDDHNLHSEIPAISGPIMPRPESPQKERMNRSSIALCALFLTLSGTASAWNSAGHMMVAAVAYGKLTPAAHARVSSLLRLNPDYSRWIEHASGADRDEVAFVMAATWPDEIKSEHDYHNDGERPSGPDAARNIGYEDHLQHRYWHFIDLPFSTDRTPLIQPQVPNAQTQIALFRRTLKSPEASDALKSYDLVWLLHLVGDVHQPLHTTSRFTFSQPEGDAGGNRGGAVSAAVPE